MRPLDGIRVLDFSRVLSGPSCGKALCDLGADVIKIEPPEGDLTRTAKPRVGGLPVYFAQQNCGKRCISIDLHTQRGAAIALELATQSDVVLENFRPGVMKRLGLDYALVREANPRVVYCSISGYGQEGVMAGRRAYAPVMHAELGLMEFNARRQEVDPLAEAVSHADIYTGVHATVGILAALVQRERTGEGQHVDVAMSEVMLQAIEWTAVELAGGDEGAMHVFGGHRAPVLRLGDDTVVCVPGDPVSTFPAWCAAMGRPDLLQDERFATHASRAANRAAMHAILQGFAATFTSFDDFEATIGAARLAVGAMRTVVEAATDEWANDRGALVDVGGEAGRILLPNSPFRFSAASAGTRGQPAWQGQHNEEVLRELLGVEAEELAGLYAAGVISERRPSAEETARR